MTTPQTYTPATRPRQGMQPMMRPAMSFICEICGKARVKGNHDYCSKTRQATGFIISQGGNGMTIDLTKLKALAAAAAANQYDAVALNDYGAELPPATVLGLIAGIERHRQINAEGCKPDSSILLSSAPCAGAAPFLSLDKAEGFKPDLNTRPSAQAVDPLIQVGQEYTA